MYRIDDSIHFAHLRVGTSPLVGSVLNPKSENFTVQRHARGQLSLERHSRQGFEMGILLVSVFDLQYAQGPM
jgi:hypothetical protein